MVFDLHRYVSAGSRTGPALSQLGNAIGLFFGRFSCPGGRLNGHASGASAVCNPVIYRY